MLIQSSPCLQSTNHHNSNAKFDTPNRDTIDGVKSRENIAVVGPTTHFNNAQQQEQISEIGFEAPSELPAQAYAKALYPFKGEYDFEIGLSVTTITIQTS